MTLLSFLIAGKRAARSAVTPQRFFRPFLERLETREVPALVSSEVVPLLPPPDAVTLTASDVSALLQRAAAADANDDAIVAIVDRNGRPLGVRVEGYVDPAISGSPETLTFSIDGALAEARTAAFFSSDQAPLTSRTVGFLAQSTVTQREVNSDPNITDPNSPLRGPGFVAPVAVGGNFPPGISYTPLPDLFNIEAIDRDSLINPGPDGIKGTADDITLPNRFNVPSQFIPAGVTLFAPESYGFEAFAAGTQLHSAQSRGLGTLPGGIPIYKDGQLVGAIGVFFPGKTGYASEENSSLSATYDSSKPDRSLEAEYVAYAAVGGSSAAGASIGTLGGVAPLSGFDLPNGRIDLVGITLNIYGPGGNSGLQVLLGEGQKLDSGNADSGFNAPLTTTGVTTRDGIPVPSGWLVTPHAGGNLTAADVTQMINQGIVEAGLTRSAIRLPIGQRTAMVFAVSDSNGDLLGLYRMPDSLTDAIGVTVEKARNAAYYDNAQLVQPIDQVAGVPAGAALTGRTFRYLAAPNYPEGTLGNSPGPFSILNVGGVDPKTGLQVGAALPASAFYGNVVGHENFYPNTNFHDPNNVANQNGTIFFPGSSAIYKNNAIAGGLGASGDGVNQDDVVTEASISGFEPPSSIQADNFFVGGARLPYIISFRNPEG